LLVNDTELAHAIERHELVITPFEKEKIEKGVVSYGLSSFGYDIRLDSEFASFSRGIPLDPHAIGEGDIERLSIKTPFFLQPHSFILAQSLEYFVIPANMFALVVGKSTWARLGLVVNTTPLEPRWNGHITLELSNTTFNPITLYPGEGIAQVVFFRGETPSRCYGGKYSFQGEPTLPLIGK
jgi:dCTP deaminase